MSGDKLIKVCTISIFVMVLVLGSIVPFFMPQKDYSDRENRMLETKPQLSAKDIVEGDCQKQYENYLSDHFVGRDRWTALAAGLEKMVGKRDINGVYIGKDGYLLERYGRSDFDRERIEDNAKRLADCINALTQMYGKEHVSCIMVPSKTQAMADKLPKFASNYDENKIIKKLQKKLNDKEQLMDASEILQEHKGEYIYYRTDHHWTSLGAYYTYTAWAKKQGYTPKTLADFDRKIIFDDFLGTTYNKVHLVVPKDEVELFRFPKDEPLTVREDGEEETASSLYFPKEGEKGFNRYNVFLSKNTFKIEIDTQADTGKTLILVKDSFANCFVPFLLEEYDKIIMLDFRYGKTKLGEILNEYEDVTDILVMYNTVKFAKDTNLRCLTVDGKKPDSMEKFDAEEFFSDF